ncbi:hypothetical protein [Streptomyces sp. STR69]|uniref:hypothetical protein n=1 Tax=Streptomyces sp. STR69 TaxID=1796942 RepID=UPI0021C57F04|nr:hypothetical protein [Streptomyces sp. STR69]
MTKISGRRLSLATALSVVAASAVIGLGLSSPANAVCTQSTSDSPGCGSTSSPSPTTPSPTATDVKPTDGAALPSSGPTITAAPSPSTLAPVSGAATVKGVFTLGNGSPLAGATVTLTPVDEALPADGSTITPTTVGTATTAADGSWSFTLPSTLPSSLQTYADDNGGVLSLEASFYGQASDGTVLTGSDYVDAGVATGSATTEGSAAARAETANTVAIHPDVDTTQVTPADSTLVDSADTADDSSATSANTYQSVDGTSTTGFSPDVVDGVDYSAVKPKIGVPVCVPSKHVIKQHDYYTSVGEAHAYYDTTAAFEYNNTLSSTWGVATSVDGEHWSITGKVSRKSSTGHAVGFANQGPYWAKRFQIPVEYQDVDHQVACPEGKVTHSYSILPVKYDIPSGGAVARYGADVRSKDGLTAYRKSNPAYRARLDQKQYATITSGTSLTIGYAAKVFGVTISLDTEYGTSHFQKITAGSGSSEHDIWGAKGKISGNPGVIYSY